MTTISAVMTRPATAHRNRLRDVKLSPPVVVKRVEKPPNRARLRPAIATIESGSEWVPELARALKKSYAQVPGAFDNVESKMKSDPLQVFRQALDNVAPAIEVRSRRVGGATYQVPVEVRPDRRRALAIRWLVNAARKRGENTMTEKLAAELLDASNNRGTAVKKREDTHKMAEANRAFSHYRW